MNAVIEKQKPIPLYDFRIKTRVKHYFTLYPGATTYAAAKALHLHWRTVQRYREFLGV